MGKTYGFFRRAVERAELGQGLTMVVITVGEKRKEGNGFADEVVFLTESSCFHVFNLYTNDGDAHAYLYHDPHFRFADLANRLGNELSENKKDWLYWNGQHFVDDDGYFPRGSEQGAPKRAPWAEELDRNPGANDFVLANPTFARRLGITIDDLRFVSLWRQAQAAAADESDPGVQKRGQEYLAKAQEQVKGASSRLRR